MCSRLKGRGGSERTVARVVESGVILQAEVGTYFRYLSVVLSG